MVQSRRALYLRRMPDTAAFWEAELTPHRSLSPRGMGWVIGFVCTASAGVTTLFWWLGAWPVAGFNGAELALAIALLRWNARQARAREVLLLEARDFRIRRVDAAGGVRETVLSPDWLGVHMQERPGRVPALLLTARGEATEVAQALGEDEKRELAASLREALHARRHPDFDNPQLREPVSRPAAPST